MSDIIKDWRNIVQWIAFIITIGSFILSGILLTNEVHPDITRRIMLTGGTIGFVIVILSYLIPKKKAKAKE